MASNPVRALNRTSTGLTAEEIFDVLRNRRRRLTIHFLREHSTPVDLRELAEQLAAWENDIQADEVTYDQRRNVQTALKQTHLPLMEASRVVEFYEDPGLVSMGPTMGRVSQQMAVVRQNKNFFWSTVYFCIGLFGGLLTGLLFFGIHPINGIKPIWYLAGLTSLITASGGIQWLINQGILRGSTTPPELLE
jgi:hypothetical protein